MAHPKLMKLLEYISADNGGCTADQWEALLEHFTDKELWTLAAGEDTEQVALRERMVALAVTGGNYNGWAATNLVKNFNEWLNRAFD